MNMAFRRLGRTDLQVSELGFGGTALGNLYQAMDSREALATVQAAYAGGIRYFDTAPLYGLGLSERRLGLALADLPEQQWLLSSKVGRLLQPAKGTETVEASVYQRPPPFISHYDYSYEGTWRSVEQSLQRLGVQQLDIIFIHDIDCWTHGDNQEEVYKNALDGVQRALVEMREQGLIKGFGLGVNEWQVCEQFLEDADPDCFLLAGRYTLLEQQSLQSFLPSCEQRDIGVIIGGPFNSGILATGVTEQAFYNYAPAPQAIRQQVQAIETVCKDFGVSLAAAALRFPLGHAAVSCVIPGAASVQEVEQNLSLIQHEIPGELWSELKRKGLIDEACPVPA